MATIYRRTYQVYQHGKPVVDRRGNKVTRQSRFYSIDYIDCAGRPRSKRGYTDRKATEQLAAKLEKAASWGREGLLNPFQEHEARPLAEHQADYIAELTTLRRDELYIYNQGKRLDILRDECEWKATGNITADSFELWRNKAKLKKGENKKTLAPRTLNQYLDTARGFCNWLMKRGRMASNPLAKVEKIWGEAQRKRRALGEDEIAKLLAAVTGERQTVYRTALATGLRRQELVDLQWGDLHLDSPTPFILLRASATKSRRGDSIPLRQDLAAELRKLKPADARDLDRVFSAVPSIDEFKADLATAKIAYKVDERQADFHSLRKTFGTLLSKAGTAPRVSMELMRHTDIKLTMVNYTDPRLFDTAGAVEKLPDVLAPAPEQNAAKATGTDDQPAVVDAVMSESCERLRVKMRAFSGAQADSTGQHETTGPESTRMQAHETAAVIDCNGQADTTVDNGGKAARLGFERSQNPAFSAGNPQNQPGLRVKMRPDSTDEPPAELVELWRALKPAMRKQAATILRSLPKLKPDMVKMLVGVVTMSGKT